MVGLVPAAAHHLGGRKDHRGRIAAGFLARPAHPIELVTGLVQGTEGAVELGAVAGGQPGCAAGPASPDDDRGPGLLHRLGQAGAVLDLVVAAVEAEPFAVGVAHKPVMMASCSSSRSNRSPTGGKGIP